MPARWMVGIAAMIVGACSSGGTSAGGPLGDAGDSGPGASRYASVRARFASPNGKITSKEDARAVMEAAQQARTIEGAGSGCGFASGYYPSGSTIGCGTGSIACGGEVNGEVSVKYSCCGACCTSGDGFLAHAPDSDPSATWCGELDLSATAAPACVAQAGRTLVTICTAADGKNPTYALTIDRGTYVASACISTKCPTPPWTVQAANGTFRCSFEPKTAGSCTDGKATYDWTYP